MGTDEVMQDVAPAQYEGTREIERELGRKSPGSGLSRASCEVASVFRNFKRMARSKLLGAQVHTNTKAPTTVEIKERVNHLVSLDIDLEVASVCKKMSIESLHSHSEQSTSSLEDELLDIHMAHSPESAEFLGRELRFAPLELESGRQCNPLVGLTLKIPTSQPTISKAPLSARGERILNSPRAVRSPRLRDNLRHGPIRPASLDRNFALKITGHLRPEEEAQLIDRTQSMGTSYSRSAFLELVDDYHVENTTTAFAPRVCHL